MKRGAGILLGVVLLILLIALCVRLAGDKAHDFYAANLRASLFSGCLTLGSFLLAVNTFIVVNLKKEVYDTKPYKKIVEQHRVDSPTYEHYRPLRNLSRALFATICVSFCSSLLQLTLGVMWASKVSAVLCVTAAVLAGAGVAIVLILVGIAMRDWFNFLEEASREPEETS